MQTLRSLLLLAAVGLAIPAALAADARPPLPQVIDEAFAASAAQYRWMLQHQVPKADRLPRTFEHGKLVTVLQRDWTVGFFPGSLWLLAEGTGDGAWRKPAEQFTQLIVAEQNNTRTHDVGFIVNCSFGNAYRLTQTPAYRAVLLRAAGSLATRFNPKVGAIKSWDRDPSDFVYPVIIDNMMNLELLLWAAENGGDARWREIALAHADTTLREHFRADASTFHVVDFDPATGRPARKVTHQGIADGSAWARGQTWGLYGYTLMYRFTREARYLAQAEKIAAFLMNHPRLPADKVPYWDFDDPKIPQAPRDASAAAIMCSALYELAGFTTSSAARDRYAAFAEEQLRSLASSAYLARPGENGGFLLMHCVGNMPKKSEVDTPINYADYYFLEALLRARAWEAGKAR